MSHQEFATGCRVRVQGLVAARQLIGKEGVLTGFIEETQRWLFPSPLLPFCERWC